MMIVGAPICKLTVDAVEAGVFPLIVKPATAPPAAPATATAIHNHLCPPPELRCAFDAVWSGELVKTGRTGFQRASAL